MYMSGTVSHSKVLTRLAVQLLLGQDDLHGAGVVRVGDHVIQDADRADDTAHHLGLAEALHVGRVANDHGGGGLLAVADDAGNLAVLDDHLLDGRVEHVGAAVDGAQTGEGLGETANTVHGVEEGRVTVLAEGGSVELHLLHGLHGGLSAVAVVGVEGDGVAEEINGVLFEGVLLEERVHVGLADIHVAVGHGVLLVDLVDVQVEVAQALLLEQTHQGALEGLLVGGGHLADHVLGVAEHAALLVLEHVGGVGALPL